MAARLALRPRDPAARALRAYTALAALGAPRRPLGEGALGLAAGEEVLRDLVAAREIPGPAGARAAWLLVDLLAGERRDAEARAALEAARGLDAREAATLERLVAADTSAFLNLGYRWQSQVYYALTQDPDSLQPSFGIFSIAAGLDGTHWRATVFLTNVFNTQYAIDRGRATEYNISPYAAPFTDAIFWTPGRDAFRYAGIKYSVNF